MQYDLTSRLLHRDLANKTHNTNVHKHYRIPYHLAEPQATPNDGDVGDSPRVRSFFNASSTSEKTFEPIDPAVHRPLTIGQFLNRKLRWITLGGQYDWTEKAYPKERPPDFPQDIADLVGNIFPDTNPEAAIVNVYSPGDTLSLHRDVSEDSSNGLVSISLGCDGIFIAGTEADDLPLKYVVIRLRSGDTIFMQGPSRYAWHGVPQIIPNTCPEALSSWPALRKSANVNDSELDVFKAWRGWYVLLDRHCRVLIHIGWPRSASI